MKKNKFFWGNSASSMQTEGAWQEGGKGLSVYDVRPATKKYSDWHDGIDEYHRYKEDISLMAGMGVNFYRFQISWSRVNPDGDGEFNQEGIAFYDRLVDELLEKGIEPMVCLYHFDMPLNLAKKENGFVGRATYEAFVRYGKKMVDHFADRVKYWITFNEQNCFTFETAFVAGGNLTAPEDLATLYTIQHHTLLAYARISSYIHAQYSDLKVGGMLSYAQIYPSSPKPEDVEGTRKLDEFINNNLIDVFTHGHYSPEVFHYLQENNFTAQILPGDLDLLGTAWSDFLAFSYYGSDDIDMSQVAAEVPPNFSLIAAKKRNPYLRANEWGWQIDPLGFRNALNKLWIRGGVPVFPVENGIGAHENWDGKNIINDQYRIEYHRNHIMAMQDAMKIDGVPVLGYLGWGLIDILSSSGDMEKRYGAVYVNRSNHDLKDMKRIPKRSYAWFKQVFESNGEKLF